ncbi:uncharacterized protein [Triticum aestivum]|uniref:uncharacterized protein n=1 Tax=Triticum aestivum TaxID=4565 RepID=UPI001D021A42|nr:uncharacterized protein LOC123099891 [Triticum aestivum]
MPAVNHWRDILRGYHLDNNAPPPWLQQKRKNNPNDVAASSSSNPRPLISVTVSGTRLNARKEGTDILVDRNSEEPSPNATISSGGEERPAVKRKIEISLGESPCNLDELVDFMHELDDTGTDDNVIGSDLSFEDFDISEPSLNLPTPPTYLYSGVASQADISNISPISTHGDTEGASNLVSGEGIMTQISAPSMDISAITKPVLDAIDLLLQNAFEALDAPTLTDSQRHEIFQAVRSMLPVGDIVPQIAPVRAAWEKFVSISDTVQEARRTIEGQSKQKSEFVTAAERRAESIEASLKTSVEEMSSMLEKQAEKKERVEALFAQLQEATVELCTAEERVKQLESDRSAKQAEAKKLHEDLLEANVKASEELEALKGKTSTLEDEVKSIIRSLKEWRSMSN